MKQMLKKYSPEFIAFLQATGIALYLIFVATFFSYISTLFRSNDVEFYAPIIMLLFFMISAVITSLLFLGKAGMLFWNKQYKEAFNLILWTVGWACLYLLLFIVIN